MLQGQRTAGTSSGCLARSTSQDPRPSACPFIIPQWSSVLTEILRIISYVNNLHPVHQKPLYSLLEELITASIPLWELSLAPSFDTNCRIKTRVSYNETTEEEVDPRHWPEEAGIQPEIGEESYEWDADPRRRQWVMETTTCTMPQLGPEFESTERPAPPDFFDEFKTQGLQVIVKLANIHLTPEKPKYKGGSWHIEGQLVSFSFSWLGAVWLTDSHTERTHSRFSNLLLLE